MLNNTLESKRLWLKRLWLLAAVVAVPLSFSLASFEATAQNSRAGVAGNIVGNIDGVSYDGEQAFLSGWACQQGQKKSISVKVYADHLTSGSSDETLVEDGAANLDSESGVGKVCQDREGGKHRFVIELPSELVTHGRNSKLYVRGVRIMDGVGPAIAGSGKLLADLPAATMQFPTLSSFRPLSGSYRSVAQHPRVFTTTAEPQELAARINRPGSYSMQRFSHLAAQIKHDLASTIDWSAAYSGCRMAIYLYAFSYEPQDGDAAPTVHSVLQLGSNVKAPAGAAVVASRLALYAALMKAGANPPANAPSPDQAAALAKRILLAWGEHGFRDEHGHFLTHTQYCDDNGKPQNPLLHISRGIVFSVQAQDLLMYLDALDDNEVKQLNAFHFAIYDVIRRASNSGLGTARPACEYYTNGGANALAALLGMARLLDDRRKFDAVVHGVDRTIPVWLPWTVFSEYAIYGKSDSPLECFANTGRDDLTSRPGFVTPDVAAGEVQDRYRNNTPLQGFGYPMFTLERLIDAAEVMRIAGFDSYGYRGRHGQSIEMALGYYACFGKGAGFGKTVTAANSGSCPNVAQYVGRVVIGVDQNETFGAYRFPGNALITDVEAAAKLSASGAANTLSTDAIFFGKWRD
jgi:hypothetical protein